MYLRKTSRSPRLEWVSHGCVHVGGWLTVVVLILSMAIYVNAKGGKSAKYEAQRQQILKNENSLSMSGQITFTEEEATMVAVMKQLKLNEYHEFNEELFYPAQCFTKVKTQISSNSLFSFLNAMPKGASLHTHILAATSAEYIVSKLSYEDNLYMYYDNGRFKLHFMNDSEAQGNETIFTKVASKRQQDGQTTFDEWLLRQLTITESETTGTKTKRWAKLSGIFSTLFDMLTYRPVFEKYLTQALQELLDDNVLFAEFRGTFMKLYDFDVADGMKRKFYDEMESLQIMSNIINNFTTKNKDNFIGATYTFAPYRKLSDDDFHDALKLLEHAHSKYPHLVVGFDLVGHEDAGGALRQRAEKLQRIHKNIRFYFHAGETNWHGTEADENLVDAMLLGSSRIGHALSLANHPELMRIVHERRIAIEVAPISNQVLGYIHDLRAHPAALLAKNGVPLVICNDDPTAFGNTGLTYDFYEAFMAFTSVEEGPEFLKALALNSIGHSSMNTPQKKKAYEMFEEKWKIWAHGLLAIAKYFGKRTN